MKDRIIEILEYYKDNCLYEEDKEYINEVNDLIAYAKGLN